MTDGTGQGQAGTARADLLVVGGGINGAGIARDAAGRGLRVVLCEQADLASATSSASSKLIHGGLRYLEHFELRLVHEALAEREILLRTAPHLVWPMHFVLPHNRLLRPAWMIRVGLFLYDVLSRRRKLEASHGVDLRRHPAGAPLQPQYRKGFIYSDCGTDDSRLVVATAQDAARHGALVLTRTRLVGARREGDTWHVTLEDRRDGSRHVLAVRALVNVAGPWADRLLSEHVGRPASKHLRLVKGSHLVFPRLYDAPYAYLLQNVDGRVVFLIPYRGAYTLVGTTEVAFDGEPDEAAIDPDEAAYLCEAVSRYLAHPVRPGDAVWSYAGVRPLVEEEGESASAVSRDYTLELDESPGAPLLTVFGGKLTTYRKLGERALEALAPHLHVPGRPWTADATLPGGDLPAGVESGVAVLTERHPWLPATLARRYAEAYGSEAGTLLDGADGIADLGRHFGADLYEREVAYLVRAEWVEQTEDILWRRSKLGLALDASSTEALAAWLREHDAARPRVGEALARLADDAPAPAGGGPAVGPGARESALPRGRERG